jgi:hypothetical protein
MDLRFSETWQEAIVGHCLSNFSFFVNARQHLKPEWFHNPLVHEIVRATFELYDSLSDKRAVRPDEVDGRIYQKFPDYKTYQEYRSVLYRCMQSAGVVGLDVLTKDLTTWIRIIKLKDLLVSGERLFNSRQYDRAADDLSKMLQDVQATEFAPPVAADFSDPVGFFRSRKEEFADCLTFGHPDFDDGLREGAKVPPSPSDTPDTLSDITKRTRGGLARGDSTVLVGPTNAGKTTVCVTVIAWNIRLGKKVLYITLEQKQRDIQTKIWQSYLGASGPDLSRLEENPQLKLRSDVAKQALCDRLTYISYLDPTKMWVEDVLALIQRQQEDALSKTGKGYDLLLVDYPGKLKSQQYTFKRSAGWEEKVFIYQKFYDVARYYNMHGLYPVQTNREGYKVNRGDGNRWLDNDDIAEAFGITHGADNVITINRSASDEARGLIKFYVSKARLGRKRWGFVSETRFDVSRTHGLGLKGEVDMSGDKSRIDQIGLAALNPAAGRPGGVQVGAAFEAPVKAVSAVAEPSPFGTAMFQTQMDAYNYGIDDDDYE